MKVKVCLTVLLFALLTISSAYAQNAPVLVPIGAQTVNENSNFGLSILATDIDGDSLILSMVSTDLQPTTAYFTDLGNGYGSLYWPITYDDSGTYLATFVVSDGSVADTEIVTITVVNVNRAPVISTIGDKATDQNALLTFTINTVDSDSDGVAISLDSAATDSLVIADATLVDNGDSTATFSWTPVLGDHGTHDVRFKATDGMNSTTQAIEITVTGPPTLNPIGNKSVNENQQLQFIISASDPDGDKPKLVMVLDTADFPPLPGGAVFTDNGDGTATFDWTPTYDDANANNDSTTHVVIFYAIDTVDIANGVDTVSEKDTIFVFDVNRPPVMANINDTTITEGDTLVLSVTATDPETSSNRADSLVMTTSSLPSEAVFIDSGLVDSTIIDSGRGSGLFTWITSPTKAASYEVHVTFYVRDFEFDTSFVDSGTFIDTTFLDTIVDTGIVSIDTLTKTDTTVLAPVASGGVDSQQVVITVLRNPQQPPILNPIGQQVIAAGSTLSFTITATDTNGTTPVLSAVGLPDSATFTDNNDGTGDFSWTPMAADVGRDTVIFFASDGQAVDSEVVEIIITPASNQAPAFDSTNSNQTVNEGEQLQFVATATDPDGTVPIFSGANFPPGATLTDNKNGSATFNWSPSFTQGGVYLIDLIATDGVASDTIQVYIEVTNVDNQPPLFDAIGSKSLTEGDTVSFLVSASDPEGKPVTFVSVSVPGARLDTVGMSADTATFFWSPSFCQAGTHQVVLTASDGDTTGTITFTIVVTDDPSVVLVPVLDPIGFQTFTEDVLDTVVVTTTTPPGCPRPSLGTISILPPLASFTDLGNGTGLFIWRPGFTQGDSPDTNFAEYTVIFDADHLTYEAPAVETVTVRVMDVGNQAPVIVPLEDTAFTIFADDTVSFTIRSADPDSTIPVLSMTSPLADSLPAAATFVDNGDGTGRFFWIADTTKLGLFNLTFFATDSDSARDSVKATVNLAKGKGRITLLGVDGLFGSSTDTVKTCEALKFYFGLENNIGETIREMSNGFRIYSPDAGVSWDTTFGTDYGTLDTSVFLGGIRYDSSNVDGIGADTVGFSGSSPFPVPPGILDGFNDTVWTITIGPITADMVGKQICIDSSMFLRSGTKSFWKWQLVSLTDIFPDWGGPYCFTIVDPGTNRPAVINPTVDSVSVTQCTSLSISLSGSDPDLETPTFESANLPSYATLIDSGNGAGSIMLAPDASDSVTVDSIIVSALDPCRAGSSDTIIVSIVNNNPPVVSAPSDTVTVAECSLLSVLLSSSDVEGATPALSVLSVQVDTLLLDTLPSGATFVDNGNGTGLLSWTPTGVQSETYIISFVGDDSCKTDTLVLTVIVQPEAPPVLDLIPTQVIAADSSLVFVANVSDQGGAGFATLTIDTLPGTATFVDNGDGTGTFSWSPTIGDVGNYTVVITATDSDCGSSVSQEVVIQVLTLPPPVITVENSTFSVIECDTLVVAMSAVDPNGFPLNFSFSSTPNISATVDTTVGPDSANFTFVPVTEMAGSYALFFFATDSVGLVDSQAATITVNVDTLPSITFEVRVNRVTAARSDTIGYVKGDTVHIFATGVDPESVPTTIWVDTLPDSAIFFASPGNGIVIFASEHNPKGYYDILFNVSDGCGSATGTVTLMDSAVVADTTADTVISEVEVEETPELPEQFNLAQNYPNPFNPVTTISFDIAKRSYVKLSIYNLLGQNVRMLVDEVLSANRYRVEWDGLTSSGTPAASGVYFYKIQTDSYQKTRKMILLK